MRRSQARGGYSQVDTKEESGDSSGDGGEDASIGALGADTQGRPRGKPLSSRGACAAWQRATFAAVTPLIKLGVKRPIEVEDIPVIGRQHRAARWARRMREEWHKQTQAPGPRGPSIWMTLWPIARWRLLVCAGYMAATTACVFGAAHSLKELINFVAEGDQDGVWSEGAFWTASLTATSIGRSLFRAQYDMQCNELGMDARSGMSALIFDKLLRLTTNTNKGTVSTLLSVDVARLDRLAHHIHFLWSSPVALAVGIAMIWNLMGTAALPALLIGLCLGPINWRLSQTFQNITETIMSTQQKRMTLTSEVVEGALVTKLFGWEDQMARRINEVREKELSKVRQFNVALAGLMTVILCSSTAIGVACFGMFALLGGEMTAAIAFPALYLIDFLTWPLLDIPWVIGTVSSSMTSMRRVVEFLARNDVYGVRELRDDDEGARAALASAQGAPVGVPAASGADSAAATEDLAIVVANATYRWEVPPPDHEEETEKAKAADTSLGGDGGETDADAGDAVSLLAGAAAARTAEQAPAPVMGLSLQVRRGMLVACVGKVGAGKSSLLAALLGELRAEHSNPRGADGWRGCAIRGSVAYVPQEAWIRSATIRDNIILDSEYDESRYNAAVRACNLTPDFESHPAGDMTEVGEKGVTMSGGQKARVALARAVYQDRDVYLLDDPLSAVDAHVGRWLFDECISGALAGKTRVLVTHQVQFLPRCDVVLVMHAGRVQHYGTYDELQRQGVSFASLVAAAQDDDDAQEEEKAGGGDGGDDGHGAGGGESKTAAATAEDKDKGKLVEEEERYRGKIGKEVVFGYLRSLGSAFFIAGFFSLSVLLQLTTTAMDLWLAMWSKSVAEGGETSGTSHLVVYALLGLLVALMTAGRNVWWFHASYVAARKLHARMLATVVRAPMSWFHATPQGRLLNRFSKDVETVDSELPDAMSDSILGVLMTLTRVIMLAVAAPLFLVALPFLVMAYAAVAKYYRASSREIRRINSITKSPLQSKVTDMLDGLASVRAFGLEKVETSDMWQRQDDNNAVNWTWQCINRWLSVRINAVSIAVVLVVSTVAVLSRAYPETFGQHPVLYSLAISYSISLSGTLSWAVRTLTNTESEMASVERILHYCKLPSEAPLVPASQLPPAGPRAGHSGATLLPSSVCVTAQPGDSSAGSGDGGDDDSEAGLSDAAAAVLAAAAHLPHNKPPVSPPEDWPRLGTVTYTDVVMHYRPDLPPVLRGVSFRASHGEKIGVVGRTGAGKSSLMMTLFRIVEVAAGTITVDGVDIGTLGLRDLRTRLSIIPQDPKLYSGPLRANLHPLFDDPMERARADGRDDVDDAAMWDALAHVGMADYVRSLPKGLDTFLEEGGRDLSVGQRQLICLARAMLRKRPVLVMDEATASVDPAADALIQTTVRESFADVTVLTIAHRLPTVIDYDKIMVMDAGRVAEFDSPATLLAHASGMFSAMVDSTGAVSAAFLRRAAVEAAAMRKERGASHGSWGAAASVPPPLMRFWSEGHSGGPRASVARSVVDHVAGARDGGSGAGGGAGGRLLDDTPPGGPLPASLSHVPAMPPLPGPSMSSDSGGSGLVSQQSTDSWDGPTDRLPSMAERPPAPLPLTASISADFALHGRRVYSPGGAPRARRPSNASQVSEQSAARRVDVLPLPVLERYASQ